MLALSRVQVPQLALIRELIETVGSAKELLENADSIGDIVPGATPRLRQLLCDSSLVELAEKEMEFIESKGIKLICYGDDAYPARLAECADVITPNLTEANLLLGREPDAPAHDPAAMAEALSDGGRRSVVITGVSPCEGQVGALWFDRDSGKVEAFAGQRVDAAYPGTGDLFTSVLTGVLVRGESLDQGARQAVEFVRLCAAHTLEHGLPTREGVEFEPLLGRLVP